MVGYPNVWGVNRNIYQMSDFQAPHGAKYITALNAIKSLCQYYDCDTIFETLRADVERR